MKRNLSVLQFQRRLIRCALKSPTAEAYRLLGIVSSNLKEFVEVRIPLDPDFEIVADELIEVYGDLERAIAKTIPEVYECNSANHYDAVIDHLTTIITDYLKERELEPTMSNQVKALAAFFSQASKDTVFYEVPDEIGVIEYIHYALMPYFVHEALDLDLSTDDYYRTENLDSILYDIFSRRFSDDVLAWNEFSYEIQASRKKIAPPSPRMANTVTAISNIIQWATSDTRDYDVKFSMTIYPDDLAKGYKIYTPANVRQQTYASGHTMKFIDLEMTNPILMDFDCGVQMLLDHMVEGEIEMGKYDDDSPEISGVRGVKITRPNDQNQFMQSSTFLRGPFPESDGMLRHIMREALMMDKQLIDQICTCTTLSEVARLASPDIYRRTRWETTLGVHGLGIQSVAMTVYRTGAIQRNANNEICFSDSNVALMLFLAYMLKGNASFFLELRARGNTLSNLQFMELLRNCGAKVHVVPNSRFFKHKVHAKVLMARFWDNNVGGASAQSYTVTAVSTGNWEKGAQDGFSDSVLIRRGISKEERDAFKDFWSALGVMPGDERPHFMRDTCDTLYWAPRSIKEALINQINYCRRATQVEYNHDLWAGLRRPFFAPHARIRIKCNHLTDPDIINALLLAVYAGVDVSIIVRTTCTMPLNTGEEKLEIHSIAGKYLEHDRFYLFETETIDGNVERTGFISSADLMPRNLENRIEIMQKIPDELFGEVRDIFDTLFKTASQPNRGFYNFTLTSVPAASHRVIGDRDLDDRIRPKFLSEMRNVDPRQIAHQTFAHIHYGATAGVRWLADESEGSENENPDGSAKVEEKDTPDNDDQA